MNNTHGEKRQEKRNPYILTTTFSKPQLILRSNFEHTFGDANQEQLHKINGNCYLNHCSPAEDKEEQTGASKLLSVVEIWRNCHDNLKYLSEVLSKIPTPVSLRRGKDNS